MIRPAEASDAELLEQFVSARDEVAFEAIIARHGPMVLAVCRRLLRHDHDADDVFQATFLLLSQKARSVRKRDSLAGWLHGVATRIGIRAKARNAERRVREERAAQATPSSGPGDELWRQLRPTLDEELCELPERYRSPLVLCYLEGQTNESAARKLGWPTGTISKVLARGRDLLRGRLLRRGVAVTGAALGAFLVERAVGQAVQASLGSATANLATLMAAGSSGAAIGSISAPVFALVKGGLKAMFLTKLKTVAAAALVTAMVGAGAGTLAYQAIAQESASARQAAAAKELDWVARRVLEWQPIPAERKLDRIGWFNDVLSAEAAARKSGRPIFLFTLDGRLETGRC
jgi:polysaccharide export outer membrane protein